MDEKKGSCFCLDIFRISSSDKTNWRNVWIT